MNGAPQPLFGWSEQAWLWIDQVGILGGNIMFAVFIAGVVAGVLNRERLRVWLTRNRFPKVGSEVQGNGNWDALVFTVSNSDVPNWVMDQVGPRVIGMLVTEFSRERGERIAEHARGAGMRILAPVLIDDPDDPAEARTKTARLLQDLQAAGSVNVAVDVTGGKTPMSIGAFMAAEEAGVDTLYVTTKFDTANRRPQMDTARIRCVSSPEL